MSIKCVHLVGLLVLLMGGANALFDHTLKRDFPGPYCARENTCCKDRHDGCSVPISSMYTILHLKSIIKLVMCLVY